MPDIDSLSIKISAEATSASASIDKLVGKLNTLSSSLNRINGSGLTGLSNGVNRLSTAMQSMKSVGTADFTRLAKNIEKLGNINVASLNSAASSMSHLTRAFNQLGGVSANAQQVGVLASNLSKLGYKSINNAITNLPALTRELNNLMTVLSKAPTVSNNVIQMTNALANLASQGGRVGMASRTLVSGLNNSTNAMNRASKSSMSLAAAFGKFYATWFLAIRGIKKLWKSVESSMDYIEVLNYFDAAFTQVAEKADLSSFREMGYASAEEYAKSFSERAKELTAQMTGFAVTEKGTLEATGMPSLGLDPSQLMQYQAMFGQMASSMGVASETSLKLSKALTEIGADLASVKNMDFDKVWNDMASGLAGMSRTLDKYGVNIRNVNLQQKLTELGIDANITALNQNEKALLRTIILLDSTRYAWGDLADTINQPANQLRLINANFQNLGRTIGNLFLPIVQKVLPYINGLVIALQRLFTWVGNFLGIDLSKVTTSVGETDFSDLIEGADDVSESLGDAADKAKKLKGNLQGFDKLNIISSQDDSEKGAGLGAGLTGGLLDVAFEDALSEYQKKWDEAFSNMENRAQELADKVEKFFEPIKKIIQDFAVGDFFQAGKDVSNLVVSITDFFARAIDNVDWYGIGQKIGDFLAGVDWLKILKSVENLIWQALKAAFELYVGAFSAAPLETAVVSLVAMPKLLKAITASKFITGIAKLWKNFGIWGEKIQLVVGAMKGNKAAASGLSMLYPKLGNKVDAVRKAFSNFGNSVLQKGLWKTIDGGITQVRNSLGLLQKGVITAIAGFAEFSIVSDTFEGLVDGSENLVAGIAKIGATVAAAAAAMYTALGPAGLAITAIVGVTGAIKGINDAFDAIRAEEIGRSIQNAMSNPGGVPLSEITAQFSGAIEKIGDSFSVITEKAAGLEQADTHIRDTWMEIEKIETSMDSGVLSVEEGTAELTRLFGELAQTASDKFGQLETTLIAAFGENGALTEVYEKLGVSTENIISDTIELHDKANKRIEELTKKLAEMDPSNPNYVTYKEELARLMAQTGDLSEAFSKFEFNLKKIDYSDVFENGEFQIDRFNEILSELSTAVQNANTDISSAIDSTRAAFEEEKSLAESLGDWAKAEEYQEKLDALPDALSLLQEKVGIKAAELTDTIQIDLINGMNTVIEDAKTEWGEKGWFGQWWNGVWGGADTEAAYVQEAVNKQVENIDQVSAAINEQLGDLKVDGIDFASDAVREIYKTLFGFGDNEAVDRGLKGLAALTIHEDYEEVINNATSGLAELTAERGKEATEGYASGFSDSANIQNAQNEAKTFTEKVLETIAKTQDSHSPSKVTMEYGKDATDGYAEAFRNRENIVNAQNAVADFTSGILDKFSEVIEPLKQIGIDAMSGLLDGLSSMEQSLYDKAQSIANGIAQTIKTALDIHSPSRVMFELGDFTMQGLQNGIENLYQPILHSVKDFSYDLQVAPAPNIESLYGNYQASYVGDSNYGTSPYVDYSYRNDNAETNALLKQQNELLRAILQKPNLGNDDIFNAAREIYIGEATRRYGNSSAFDPVWG